MRRVPSAGVIACCMYIRLLDSTKLAPMRKLRITCIHPQEALTSQLDGFGWLWSGVQNR